MTTMSVDEYWREMQRLREERDEAIADYCWKCDTVTRRVDRLCASCHDAAEDMRLPT